MENTSVSYNKDINNVQEHANIFTYIIWEGMY